MSTQDPGLGGRELSPAITTLSAVVAVVSILTGALLAVAGLTGHAFGAWHSPEALSPGLIGAAMVGVSPGLLVVGRARVWEEVRTLVLPTVVVLVGLFAVSVADARELHVATGGLIVPVLFSLGWVATLGALAAASVLCLVVQYRRPVAVPPARIAPLPAWSKPLLAVLGSGWLGLGTGLVLSPRFWGGLVPWAVGRADAQGLGVWCLALGVGVLGALAEDDLARLRPALISVPGVALASAVLLAGRAGDVTWSSGAALPLVVLLAGLLSTGAIGHWLWTRRSVPA
ncbi:hypothetical protein AB0C76_27880 [Kitasatospora sp. NPDC048722]|uniref:hypothetical protein n=1 Tax=Kitasatospora sp. NPDC048722 TaxID=3155639 RepID=UPI0033D2403B